jgi:TRAP-type mannitol/chloroaromatic compound transport system substrate-binding protein
MLQSYHQNAEQLEITFNKTKYDALPPKLKALIANAVDASSANMMWKAIDRNSQDYITLQSVDKVKFYKTPPAILQKTMEVYDQVIEKKSKELPIIGEIVASQKKFAERAVKWEQDVVVSRAMAYNHYFGKAAAPAAGKKA